MNDNQDPYQQYEVIRGRKYRYDPDFDCWYRHYDVEETAISKWSWIWVSLSLALAVWLLEYYR